ncbi:MAG: hypothetical protein KKF46_05700 [Nanoarchaeota archaeon]|nr:hypothetical protein [Nanoarchaeota archaeon]MBU1321826.1 hypothetical protein [Nanoarchaeota archaeon]MBU1597171.1 hypothetical protein [Nanoarchaeota archaeon]MBU2441656.1 hypothetical protein [Nanoarchaeota archaeon]
MLDEILRRVKGIKKQMEENLPYINDEIQALIKNKNQTVDRIEEILDILLNYGQLRVGEAEFKKLNTYYSSFNPTNAKFYTNSYKEMNED